MVINPRGTPRIEAAKKVDRPPKQERRGRAPRPAGDVRGECGCHEHPHADHGKYPLHHGYPPEAAGMASSHGSLVGWNRAAEHYRNVDPALLRLGKAPERVCIIHHRITMTPPTRQG